MPRTRLIIYGIATPAQAEACARAGADAVGLEMSRRGGPGLAPEAAWDVLAALPPLVASVGVLRDPSEEDFLDIEERCPTDYSQLDGAEPADLVARLGPRLFKTVDVPPGGELAAAAAARAWATMPEVDAVVLRPRDAADLRPVFGTLASAGGARAILALPPGLIDRAAELAAAHRPWGLGLPWPALGEGGGAGATLERLLAALARADLGA
ncbi:MAG TPA: hypothetical protein VD963_05715 [Phycisphaerales bacterium]|nr:hypothetical protein [Phycisphaerales bacterium]